MDSNAIANVISAVASRMGSNPAAISDQGLRLMICNRASGIAVRRTSAAAPRIERRGSVAIFHVDGIMSPHAEWSDETDTVALASELQAAAADPDVTAGVLAINSPGGYSAGMRDLADAAVQFAARKPLLAQVDQVAASAGYWLATAAHSIVATSRDDEVGSIGVRSLIYDFSELFKNFGIEAVDTATGDLKSLGVMGAPVTEKQREYLRSRVDAVFGHFSSAVQSRRNMTPEQFAAVSDGRTFLAEQAMELGLIDGIQSFEETLADLTSGVGGPRVAASAAKTQKEKTMADTATQPVPAKSFAELAREQREAIESACPGASENFINSQLASGATPEAASREWMKQLAADRDAATERAEAAEKEKAELAKAKADSSDSPAKPKSSAGLGGSAKTEDQDVDYAEMARDYQQKHKCRWSDACLAIKRRHPEARAWFIDQGKQARLARSRDRD